MPWPKGICGTVPWEEVGRVWLLVTGKGGGLSSNAFEYQKAVG